MLIDFIKAIIVGIAASVPIGPIAILVIQKTLCKGFKSGFVTSLGSTVVDTLFAMIAVFSLAFVQEFIEGNSIPIFIGGGIIIIILGLRMSLSDPFRKMKAEDREVKDDEINPKDFLSAIAMGLSNPGAIAVIFALLAFFGIAENRPNDWSSIPVILGVAAGSASYWLGITALLSTFRKQFNMKTIIWINRITGAIVIIVGIATFADGIFKILAN